MGYDFADWLGENPEQIFEERMKLITLNIWGGHVHQPLLDFIKRHQAIDVFCFQEVYHKAPCMITDETRFVSLNIFDELQALLPNHRGFFRPVVKGIYGVAMFIKKEIEVIEEGEVTIHENPDYSGIGPTHSRNMQWAKCQVNNQPFYIMNVHGLWNGKGKTDAPERIVQSEKIKAFVDKVNAPKIVCGDFNLRPDTESLKIIQKGMQDLIELYKVDSTRTSLYPKEEKFADYVFASPGIGIRHFEVLKDEVSDHSALLVEFS
jgi:endonuclease/exonuclease/phosphatase family metal-dependent hydrolase